MVIRLLDHVARCSTYEDGEPIFRLIVASLNSDPLQVVEVSFDGVTSVPSAFVNAAFVRLLELFPFGVIKNRLVFKNTTKQINNIVRDRFSFAAGRKDE